MASPGADTFTQYPLHLDPTSKAISAPSCNSAVLDSELESLNQLHRALLNLDSPNTPPPPKPVNPKRSAQIAKLREAANTAFRKSSFGEAVKLYTYAIDMAIGRPTWEHVDLLREELPPLFTNRAQAYMAQQQWPEAYVDAKSSVEIMPSNNGKSWWRGGRCLIEMGRWQEATEWISNGLDAEGNSSEAAKELKGLMVDVERGWGRERSSRGWRW
ncbi:F-box domain-containing protein [Histoplasma capsulatum var. duboisii H88]|uniref:F-box domain-containing protein n=3 Tax=Ajellomyces capsulatus TaxID=5037 RepID=F0UEQ0_AJEC8|nr:F-box protein [Histoplasma capsulatum H143]EGC44780.1 F-box domain-containing protein [Histoplasma capsulatum var. duboisii H88]